MAESAAVLPAPGAWPLHADAVTDYAVAPGEYLLEWIENQPQSEARVAELLHVDPTLLVEILAGNTVLDEGLAARLATVTGIPAETWLRIEANYRADVVRLAAITK